MQSQPRNISVSLGRSRMDPSINTAPFFKSRGGRTARMTGVSPLSSNLGTSVWPRFPDPPVSSAPGLLDRPPPKRDVREDPFDFATQEERSTYDAVKHYIDRRFEELEQQRAGKGFVM